MVCYFHCLCHVGSFVVFLCLALVVEPAEAGMEATTKRRKAFSDTSELIDVVRLWQTDPIDVGSNYGPIERWNISNITSMASVFYDISDFEHDYLSQWDVSRVTSARWLFHSTTTFRANLTTWDTRKWEDLSGLFAFSTGFTSNLKSFRHIQHDFGRWHVQAPPNLSQ